MSWNLSSRRDSIVKRIVSCKSWGRPHESAKANPMTISFTDEDDDALGTQCLLIHTWRRCFEGISHRPSLLYTVWVYKYRKEGGGVRPEEENRKPHLAAARGGAYPSPSGRSEDAGTDRLSHLAQAQMAPIHRDEMWHPCPAFEYPSSSSATDQQGPLGLRGRGPSEPSLPFFSLPHLQKCRSLRGGFAATKLSRIPSTCILGSADWQ